MNDDGYSIFINPWKSELGSLSLLEDYSRFVIELRQKLLGKCAKMGGTKPANRGVFGQQFDQLVFENFSKFMTKRAEVTMKE